jgi:hypothetical protein
MCSTTPHRRSTSSRKKTTSLIWSQRPVAAPRTRLCTIGPSIVRGLLLAKASGSAFTAASIPSQK